MAGPMDGIRVVEVAQWWFVPAAGTILADWGADVIKIEHPVSGDPQRGLMSSGLLPAMGGINFMMEQSNRGKRSIGLDIATDGGRELLYELAKGADVFLTNFLPDARERLRIDVDDIRAVNPDIVYVRGHGQGSRGPDAGKGGYDAASFWARGGVGAALTPADAESPVMQKAAFGDSIGAMTVAGGIAAALLQRARGAPAPVVDVSLLGTAMWVMAPDIGFSKLLGFDLPAGGSRSMMPNPLVNSFRTSDERWITMILLQPDKFWPSLCEHIGHPELIDDPRFKDIQVRGENKEACLEILDAAFGSRTLDEWKQALQSFEGVWAPMQKPSEIYNDPQAIANNYLPEVMNDDGTPFQLVASPVQFDETTPQLRRAPEHGQHTEEILLELGLDWDAILAHKEAGAIL
jgi:crotonobetainyl-CoA:carnitine CoA-transferase CaiB-like acyl-CoA transferase